MTMPEVERLAAGERVTETVRFGPSDEEFFSYTVLTSGSRNVGKPPTARFEGRGMMLDISAEMISDWAGSDVIGIYSTQPTGEGRFLSILIEKDLGCSHRDRNVAGSE